MTTMEVRPMESITLRCVMPRGFDKRVKIAALLIKAAALVLGCGVEVSEGDSASLELRTGGEANGKGI